MRSVPAYALTCGPMPTADPPSSGRTLSLSKSLHAGEGFLSQSSKWVHFGLGPGATIERVVVRWPDDSEPETFAGVMADGRFRLTQGRGVAARVDDRSPRVALSESVAQVPTPTAVARTVLTQRPQFPRLEYRDFQNQTRSLADPPAGPQLIVRVGQLVSTLPYGTERAGQAGRRASPSRACRARPLNRLVGGGIDRSHGDRPYVGRAVAGPLFVWLDVAGEYGSIGRSASRDHLPTASAADPMQLSDRRPGTVGGPV